MAKKTSKTNFRVVVDVDFNQYYSTQELQAADAASNARLLIDQIKRHCDGWLQVSYEYDTESVCTLCGYGWEVDEDGLPLCCGEAQDEFEANKPEIFDGVREDLENLVSVSEGKLREQ